MSFGESATTTAGWSRRTRVFTPCGNASLLAVGAARYTLPQNGTLSGVHLTEAVGALRDLNRPRSILDRFAGSPGLWRRRTSLCSPLPIVVIEILGVPSMSRVLELVSWQPSLSTSSSVAAACSRGYRGFAALLAEGHLQLGCGAFRVTT